MLKLINDDAIKVLKDIEDESVDLIVTDPPYNISYKTGLRKNKNHDFCKVIQNDNNLIISDVIDDLYRVLKQNGACYIFWSIKTYSELMSVVEETKFKYKNTIVWVKNSHTAGDLQAGYGQKYELIVYLNKGRAKMNGKRLTDVWEFDRVAGKQQMHQNQKPVPLLEQILSKHSSLGDIVLDPFMGSGSTGVACKNLNRNFIGIELDENYFNIAKKRIEIGE